MDGFIERGNKTRGPPSSVEQMEALILSIATGFIDQHKVEVKGNELLATLRIFGNSINELVSRFLCCLYKLSNEPFRSLKEKHNISADSRPALKRGPGLYILISIRRALITLFSTILSSLWRSKTSATSLTSSKACWKTKEMS